MAREGWIVDVFVWIRWMRPRSVRFAAASWRVCLGTCMLTIFGCFVCKYALQAARDVFSVSIVWRFASFTSSMPVCARVPSLCFSGCAPVCVSVS